MEKVVSTERRRKRHAKRGRDNRGGGSPDNIKSLVLVSEAQQNSGSMRHPYKLDYK